MYAVSRLDTNCLPVSDGFKQGKQEHFTSIKYILPQERPED